MTPHSSSQEQQEQQQQEQQQRNHAARVELLPVACVTATLEDQHESGAFRGADWERHAMHAAAELEEVVQKLGSATQHVGDVLAAQSAWHEAFVTGWKAPAVEIAAMAAQGFMVYQNPAFCK